MSFRKDNDEYETWLAKQCDVLAKDVDYKHHRMKKSAFIFLRATYFLSGEKCVRQIRSRFRSRTCPAAARHCPAAG
jgi:hypothetical protein